MYDSEDDDEDRLSTESPVKNEVPYQVKKREEEAEPGLKLGLAFFKQKQERKFAWMGGVGVGPNS